MAARAAPPGVRLQASKQTEKIKIHHDHNKIDDCRIDESTAREKMIRPTKSTTRRPSQLRPVGWPKKVEPYGGRVTGSKTEYQPKTTGLLPVSAKESPKLKMAS
uniref:Uncharacterized protein n=1 Tax=Oryza nivara TaxID=4536 RepID=A0A0E0FIM9_ORYNI